MPPGTAVLSVVVPVALPVPAGVTPGSALPRCPPSRKPSLGSGSAVAGLLASPQGQDLCLHEQMGWGPHSGSLTSRFLPSDSTQVSLAEETGDRTSTY